jgi:hypothetical protein
VFNDGVCKPPKPSCYQAWPEAEAFQHVTQRDPLDPFLVEPRPVREGLRGVNGKPTEPGDSSLAEARQVHEALCRQRCL